MIWSPYILPLSPTISSQSPSANLALVSNSSGHGGLSPPSHQVIVTAARSPSPGKTHRVIDESGAVWLAISGGHCWFDDEASIEAGCPSLSALNTGDNWWQPMSPKT